MTFAATRTRDAVRENIAQFARTCSRACTDCLLPSYLPSAQSVFCREIVGFLCPQHKCESVALHTEELLYLIHSARRGRPEHFIANAYTRSPYETAQGLSKKALTYTEPIQKRLAPILTCADGLANKGLDAVESRIPYAFHTPTQDITRLPPHPSLRARALRGCLRAPMPTLVPPVVLRRGGVERREAGIPPLFPSLPSLPTKGDR